MKPELTLLEVRGRETASLCQRAEQGAKLNMPFFSSRQPEWAHCQQSRGYMAGAEILTFVVCGVWREADIYRSLNGSVEAVRV